MVRGRRCVLLFAIIVILAALAGCRHGHSGPTAKLRLIDAVPDADSIRVVLADKTELKRAKYGSDTGYQQTPTGIFLAHLEAELQGQRNIESADTRVKLFHGHRYTAIAVGNAQQDPSARLVVFQDDVNPADLVKGTSRVWAANAAISRGRLDLLLDNIVAIKDIPFGHRSATIVLPARRYEVQAIVAGSMDAPDDQPHMLNFQDGRDYVIVVACAKSPAAFDITAFSDKQQ